MELKNISLLQSIAKCFVYYEHGRNSFSTYVLLIKEKRGIRMYFIEKEKNKRIIKY